MNIIRFGEKYIIDNKLQNADRLIAIRLFALELNKQYIFKKKNRIDFKKGWLGYEIL